MPPACPQCAWHTGATAEDVIRAEVEHVRMYRYALLDAQDAATLAHGERDFYRDELNDSYAQLQLLSAALLIADDAHHYRGDICSCGAVRCPVVDVLSDAKIARLIGTYDEHRHVLRELRVANPSDDAGVWADIDVTLVYPRRVDAQRVDAQRAEHAHGEQPTDETQIGRHRRAS